jgi:glycosyltransferase involved in cell wall biosynthesis
MNATGTRTIVSVILAIYNEAASIQTCLDSILAQDTWTSATGRFDLEVLAVDGMSNDGTQDLLESYAGRDARVRVVRNERRLTPFAFNLGLLHARGEYVCIFGAHSVYKKDYIAVCLGELLTQNAAGCGGRVVTVAANRDLSARLAAWAMRHPFGSSRKSFRTQSEGEVDTVNYPVLQRDLVLAAGGYDEELTRNQDNDLNQKLRAAGHILWCTWKTECLYFPKPTVWGLLRYAYGNGYWNALSFRKNPESMGLRHFVPFIFVVSLLATALFVVGGQFLPHLYAPLPLIPLGALIVLHLATGLAAAVQVAIQERSAGALYLPFVFFAFHCAYGYGTLSCFVKQVGQALRPRAWVRRGAVPLSD